MDVPGLYAALGLVVPSATGLAGYWLAGRNEEARDKRAEVRGRKERRALVAERLADERHAFQRELLLEIQDLLLAATRATLAVLSEDERSLRASGKVSLVSPDADDNSYTSGVALMRAEVRLLDDDLRGLISEFREQIGRCELLAATDLQHLSQSDALLAINAARRQLMDSYSLLTLRLGVAIRAALGRDVDAGDP